MTDAEQERFFDIVKAALEVCGKTEPPSPTVLALWWQALRGYALGEVSQAFSAHMQDPDAGVYAPKPADIVRVLEGSGNDNAATAWAEAERALRTVGSYDSVTFADRRINAVIQALGGWIRFCETTEEDLPFVARDFKALYQAYTRKMPPMVEHLPGRIEQHNAPMGGRVPRPRMIGRIFEGKLVAGRELLLETRDG